MENRRIVRGMTITFAALSVLLAIAGIVANPIALVPAVVFAGVAGIFYYQASGRLARRVYRRVEQRAATDGMTGGRRRNRASGGGRGGFGAGPREEWTGPHQRRGRGAGQRRRARADARQSGGGSTATAGNDGITARQAYDVLDLDPGADQEAIRTAYRDRIKEVHPDAEGGDEDAFRRVRTAYERLSD